MKINGTIVEQTGMESSGQRFIMLEPGLHDGMILGYFQFFRISVDGGLRLSSLWGGLGLAYV